MSKLDMKKAGEFMKFLVNWSLKLKYLIGYNILLITKLYWTKKLENVSPVI